MATKPTIFMGGFSVEFLNGDESFLVHVYYRDEKGIPTPESDKFSFTTAAKLKKFISKTLLTGAEDVDGNSQSEG